MSQSINMAIIFNVRNIHRDIVRDTSLGLRIMSLYYLHYITRSRFTSLYILDSGRMLGLFLQTILHDSFILDNTMFDKPPTLPLLSSILIKR